MDLNITPGNLRMVIGDKPFATEIGPTGDYRCPVCSSFLGHGTVCSNVKCCGNCKTHFAHPAIVQAIVQNNTILVLIPDSDSNLAKSLCAAANRDSKNVCYLAEIEVKIGNVRKFIEVDGKATLST